MLTAATTVWSRPKMGAPTQIRPGSISPSSMAKPLIRAWASYSRSRSGEKTVRSVSRCIWGRSRQ